MSDEIEQVVEEVMEDQVIEKPKKRRGRPPKKQEPEQVEEVAKTEDEPVLVETSDDSDVEVPEEPTYVEADDLEVPESITTEVVVDEDIESDAGLEEVSDSEESDTADSDTKYVNGMYIDGTFHIYRAPSTSIPYRIFVGRVNVEEVLGPWVKVRYSKGGKGTLIGYIPNL